MHYHRTADRAIEPTHYSVRTPSDGMRFQRSLNKPSLLKRSIKTNGNIYINLICEKLQTIYSISHKYTYAYWWMGKCVCSCVYVRMCILTYSNAHA